MEDSATTRTSDSNPTSSEDLLSQLMTALAAGARAVQGLPLEDEFEYQSSFPEFRQLIEEAHESLLDTLLLALGEDHHTGGTGGTTVDTDYNSLDDPLLWEACADVCDALLEQAERAVDSSMTTTKLQQDLLSARNQAQTSFGRLLKGIVEMEKPQDVYNFYKTNKRNDRRQPFIPPITEKYHAQTPLNLSLHPGHGLEARFGDQRRVQLPKNAIAPTHHVPHIYQTELEALEFTESQLEAPSNKPSKIQTARELTATATWIDTPQALQELATQLESVREIALDLEAHSYRTFSGMTCLIQLTFGDHQNYLIDPFPLWYQLHAALGPVLADPNIVKVLHGADSDIQWLQRDFGLHIINLFDTGRAARALNFSSAGYAYLLKHYVGVTADKTHQLSDWRQRPLPQAMKEYAIMDTHYLLDIYQHLKYDLAKHATASISTVLEESKKVCLVRYAPEPFKPDGYQSIMNRQRGGGSTKTELNTTQEQVLKELWDWRDQVARQYDESHAFVCTNTALMRLALARPTSLTTLQGLFQPMPPLLLRNAKHVLVLVQRCVNPSSKVPSSAFFKPATADRDEPRDNRLLSPVLGTEALYRQAGWISPHPNKSNDDDDEEEVADVVTTTTDDDDEDPEYREMKPRRVLSVHEANQKYRASQFSSHSLQLGNDNPDGTVDGMGPARAAHFSQINSTMEEEAQLAQANAAHIRSAQHDNHAPMIGLISPTADDMEEEEEEEEEEVVETTNDQEEFVIPRSMREIYRISNRNRRNKKAGSPLPPPEQSNSEKEANELAKAEKVLKARSLEGKNYFDEIPGSPKRQRTKSTGGASLSSEEATPGGNDSGSISREEDIALMQEIGWIKGKEEVDSMLKQRPGADGEDDNHGEGASSDEEAMKGTKPFDYSAIGPIGAFSATPSANPFFAGAATAGGHINQQFGKADSSSSKKKQNASRAKQSRRQVERPERREGRAQAYKKR